MKRARDLLEMQVAEVCIDPMTDLPIVILREEGTERLLAIGVGVQEAAAIATAIEAIELTRPTAHDLMKALLTELDHKLDRVEIHDVVGDAYLAALHVVCSRGTRRTLDARPSDAIALALRCKAPIQVARRVVERPLLPPDVIQSLSSRAFGKWKM